ncbi:MAG: hypothetical protein EOP10_06155 [Proteobacteria bacterium]|nr:MAG: hypothetical protein EOP10_06155 [Pseudomonadota bacterium]
MRFLALLLASAAFVGCSAMNVEIPSEVKTSGKKADIKWSKSLTKQDPLVFAPFKTTALDIDWESGSSSGFSVAGIGGGSKSSEQGYTFTLSKEGSKDVVAVECKKTGSQSGMSIGGLNMGDAKADLNCKFANGGVLNSPVGPDGSMTGVVNGLKSGEITYSPIFMDDAGKASKTPLGYSLSVGGKAIGVLNLGKDKSYWFVGQNDALDLDAAATAVSLFFFYQ